LADDKSKRGGADRRRIAGGQAYEFSYFARKHSITTEQARNIIERCGNDREKANGEAEKIGGSRSSTPLPVDAENAFERMPLPLAPKKSRKRKVLSARSRR
jgi:hypothetical protein